MSDVNKQLLEALKELVCIVEIHCKANDDNFAWAEIDFANESIAAAEQAQAEPVAAQCRFEGEEEWSPCTLAHHLLVQAHPKEWPHYETRALYAQPPAVADRDAIRRVFMAHGFTIKDGQTDLKPYVYEAAEALLRELSPAVAVPHEAADSIRSPFNACCNKEHCRAMLAAAPQGATLSAALADIAAGRLQDRADRL